MDKPYIVNGERLSAEEYKKIKYEDLRVRVPKGEKEKIQARAKELGKSLNAYIVDLIKKDMGE